MVQGHDGSPPCSDNSIMIRLIVEINTGSHGVRRTYARIRIHVRMYIHTYGRTRTGATTLGQFTPPVKYDVTINFVPSIGWSIASSIITIERLSLLWAITMPRYNSQLIIRAVCVSSRITLQHWQKTFINSPDNFIYAPLIEIFDVLWNLIAVILIWFSRACQIKFRWIWLNSINLFYIKN